MSLQPGSASGIAQAGPAPIDKSALSYSIGASLVVRMLLLIIHCLFRHASGPTLLARASSAVRRAATPPVTRRSSSAARHTVHACVTSTSAAVTGRPALHRLRMIFVRSTKCVAIAPVRHAIGTGHARGAVVSGSAFRRFSAPHNGPAPLSASPRSRHPKRHHPVVAVMPDHRTTQIRHPHLAAPARDHLLGRALPRRVVLDHALDHAEPHSRHAF
jgi:hypothetical protein